MKTIKSTSGFTLVELLAVVAIIAVLAAVVVNSIGNTTQAAQTASAKRQVQVLNSAYQSYVAAGGPQQLTIGDAVNVLLDVNLVTPAGITGPFLLEAPVVTPLSYIAHNNVHISNGQIDFDGRKFALVPAPKTDSSTVGGGGSTTDSVVPE